MSDEAYIAGMDEVGRGALAGPVVAGACVMDIPCTTLHGKFRMKGVKDIVIADSKMMTAIEREKSALWLAQNMQYGLGVVSHELVDEKGILWATQEAMRRALKQLQTQREVRLLKIDGRDHFQFSLPHTSIIKGDSLEPCIAAASILAKVARDALMTRASYVFPEFGFDGHKGYGSEPHRKKILEVGPCLIHRKSFLRNLFDSQLALL